MCSCCWCRCDDGDCGQPTEVESQRAQERKKAEKSMNAGAKRKNKCSICKSTEHNAARCPQKVGGQLTGMGGAAV